MRNKIALSVAVLAVAGLTAFKVVDTKDHLAKVQKIDGLSVFVMSEPADPYYKLGQVGSGTVSQFNAMIKNVVKNVKTQYPDADGVMFDHEKNIGYGVKFK